MNPIPTHDDHDEDMPADIDFSSGTRGQFFRPGAQVQLPIHLDAQVQNTLASLANSKGIDISVFVNDLLKKDIELIQMAS
ncbi:MAG: hypothetical protein WCP34_15945 [Pseudomonadota bacterium]